MDDSGDELEGLENQTPQQTNELHSKGPTTMPDAGSASPSPASMDMSVLTPVKSPHQSQQLRSPSGLDDVQEVQTPTNPKPAQGNNNNNSSNSSNSSSRSGGGGEMLFDDEEGDDDGEESGGSYSPDNSDEEQLDENLTPRRRNNNDSSSQYSDSNSNSDNDGGTPTSCPRPSIDSMDSPGTPLPVPPRPPQRGARAAMRPHAAKAKPPVQHQQARPPSKSYNSNRSQIVYDATMPRYKQWRGRHKFYFGGRLMMGPNVKQFMFSFSLSLATWAMFGAFIFEELPHLFELPYAGPQDFNWSVFIIAAVECFGMVFYLFVTATSDPGIIPRKSASQLVESMPLEMKEKMNYCPTCHIVKPLRTKHCRQSDCCIRRFDHHCPWTGNSVGELNYRHFMSFIFFTTLSAGTNLFGAVWVFINAGLNGGSLLMEVICPVLIAWNALVFALVGALLGFHCMLIAKGQTTNEWLRGERKGMSRDKGSCIENYFKLCFEKLGDSYLLPMNEPPSMIDEERDLEAAEEAVDILQNELRPLG
ncbi:hypothetical protein TrVE_jg12571 [Triparma verrucosa]|uniref:Palmitoyltransferase n=1 Tax=Triparma verrucosa TaxID=1606542 RepID=A0A9W7KVX0_9STRA|nr:hypothetical protein TrVE_jg12571 [Triparma verrucosa]